MLDPDTKHSIHWAAPQICSDVLLYALLHSTLLSIIQLTVIWLFFPLFFPVLLRYD